MKDVRDPGCHSDAHGFTQTSADKVNGLFVRRGRSYRWQDTVGGAKNA